jgi:hypothetical protein
VVNSPASVMAATPPLCVAGAVEASELVCLMKRSTTTEIAGQRDNHALRGKVSSDVPGRYFDVGGRCNMSSIDSGHLGLPSRA